VDDIFQQFQAKYGADVDRYYPKRDVAVEVPLTRARATADDTTVNLTKPIPARSHRRGTTTQDEAKRGYHRSALTRITKRMSCAPLAAAHDEWR
jgi:hypothetical protein